MVAVLTFPVLVSPFVVAAVISLAAHRSGSLRLRADQFRAAAPMRGWLFDDDPDGRRLEHELDAIRTPFGHRPSWPASGALGERR
jgi:hypothetical protein